MIMFLRNAYATHRFNSLGASISGTYGEAGNTVVKLMTGKTSSGYNKGLFRSLEMPNAGYVMFYLWVGTGTDEPQFDDYNIPNAIAMSETKGFTVASVSNEAVTFDATTNTFIKISKELLRNNTTEDVVVTELYLIDSNTRFNYEYNCLFYKELLDTPITVGAGKYLEVTFIRRLKDGVMSASTEL
jgi:hypothetical protein